MTYWIEIRAWQHRVGRPFFAELSPTHATNYLGFRSVYAYDDEVRKVIEAQGSTTNLGNVSVYSDTLFLDFDNVDPVDTLLWLYDEGYAHSVWHSGNRSVHVHIPIEPMEGKYVPWSQRVWVAANIPLADVSFYTHAGQYRLPGTRHEKTGQRKVLKHQHHGRRLQIPMTVKLAVVDSGGKSVVGGQFMAQLLRSKFEGGRRVYVWHLAQQARQEGISIEKATSSILWWNRTHAHPPLTEKQVLDKVLDVYK